MAFPVNVLKTVWFAIFTVMAAKKDTASASHNVSDCQFSTINFNGYHLLVKFCAEYAPNKFSTMINLTKK